MCVIFTGSLMWILGQISNFNPQLLMDSTGTSIQGLFEVGAERVLSWRPPDLEFRTHIGVDKVCRSVHFMPLLINDKILSVFCQSFITVIGTAVGRSLLPLSFLLLWPWVKDGFCGHHLFYFLCTCKIYDFSCHLTTNVSLLYIVLKSLNWLL